MNSLAPLYEIEQDGIRVVWLTPERYTMVERMYIAARITRSYLHPDILVTTSAERHLSRWVQANRPDLADAPLPVKMTAWLEKEIVGEYHDSVVEFAGQEICLYIGGVSLATIRDVDRHRHLSYEEYTTRALGEALKKHFKRLAALVDQARREEARRLLNSEHGERMHQKALLADDDRRFLLDFFYVHPSAWFEQSLEEIDTQLLLSARCLLFYMEQTQDSKKRFGADINRSVLTMALKTPFMLAGNLRALGEASGKRTCMQVGHVEYVSLFRNINELLSPHVPFLKTLTTRWCPMQREGERCCRTAWSGSIVTVLDQFMSERNREE